MSRASYAPKETYTGTGSLDTYTFLFKIEAATQLLVVEVNDSGVETQRVLGDDTTYLSTVVFDEVNGGGTVTLAANLTLDYDLIFLLANDAPTQPYEFRNKTSFTLKRFESALDWLAGSIQRLTYRGKQSLRIHDLDDEETFDTQLTAGVSLAANYDRVLKVNGTGTGFELGASYGDIDGAVAAAAAALVSETNAAASELACATGASRYISFANDAAYVSDKGSAAADGDAYYDTTLEVTKLYRDGAWSSQEPQTKGSIKTFSTLGADLPVGANGTILTADSTEATGLKYETSIGQRLNMVSFANFATTAAAPSAIAWTVMCSQGGWFHALCPNSTSGYMRSLDYGVTWTAPAASLSHQYVDMINSDVASLLVALASGTTSGISTRGGGAWTARTTTSKTWTALCENSSLIVAVNNDGSGGDGAMYSTNGTSWTDSTACQDEAWEDIASDGTTFVAVGGTGFAGKVSTSTDGDTWTARTPAVTGTDFKNVVWDSRNSQFLANGVTATTGEYFMTSPDGITWTTGSAQDVYVTKLVHTGSSDNSIYVGILFGGTSVVTSADGVTWEVAGVKQQGTWVDLAATIWGISMISNDATGDRICNSLTGSLNF